MAQLGLAEISSEDDSMSDVEVCFDDDTTGDTEARGIDRVHTGLKSTWI